MSIKFHPLVLLASAMSVVAMQAHAEGFTATIGSGNETAPGFILGNGPNSYVVPNWAVLETFEGEGLSGAGATWAFGTVTDQNNFSILRADEWGGAGLTGGPPAGNYLAAYGGPEEDSGTRIILDNPANYIGFWWTGGEAGDSVKVYSNGQLVGEFNTADPEFAALLSDENRCGGDGEPCEGYNNGGFYYTYVNLQAPDGVLFDEIKVGGGTLELDNFVVADTRARFAMAEREITAVFGREQSQIDHGLYGIFNGANTVCRSTSSGAGAIVDGANTGFCMTIGSHSTAVNGNGHSAAIAGLDVALRWLYSERLSFGVALSTAVTARDPADYTYRQSLPMISGFVEFGSPDHIGLNVRAAVAAREGELRYDREGVASGSGNLTSWGASVDMSYGFVVGNARTVVAPFIGLHYFSSTRSAYTETVGGSRIDFDEIENESTSVQAGLSVYGEISEGLNYVLTGGVRHQLHGHSDDFVAHEYGLEFISASTRTEETTFFGSAGFSWATSEDGALSLQLAAERLSGVDQIGLTASIGYNFRF